MRKVRESFKLINLASSMKKSLRDKESQSSQAWRKSSSVVLESFRILTLSNHQKGLRWEELRFIRILGIKGF